MRTMTNTFRRASARTRPASTAERAMTSDRNRSMSPLWRSSAMPMAVFWAPNSTVVTKIPAVSYTDYLMAGIFVTTVLFGAQNTAIGMAEDLHNGLIERFRSLAMARSAVLAGRVLADAARNLFVIVLMIGVGYLVGFRLHTDMAALVAAAGVLLLFGFALSWVTALLGLAAKSAEAAAAAALPLTVLLTFPSSAFLVTHNLPGPLRAYADHQPLTATVNTVRPLLLGGPTAAHVVAATLWCAGIIAVFAPVAVLRYRRAA